MTRATFPETGQSRTEVLDILKSLRKNDIDWKRGRTPLYVFDAGDDVYEMGRAAFFEFFKENALGKNRAFPSVLKMENDIVDMSLDLLHGGPDACGFMTTGGTESIIQAVQSCRNRTRHDRGEPAFRGNIVTATSAHPAFDKAARLMDIEVRRAPVGADYRADPEAIEALMDDDTMMLVGSAPCFPYGVIDPIADLGALAQRRSVWLHVDACVGGYVAPFARMIGRSIPAFDFEVPGVCSISADLHKYGFCPKPASTVYYRDTTCAEFHAFDFDNWPSGRFYTTTICGTRPAGAIAAAWAVFHHLGLDGYKRIATELMEFVDDYRAGIKAIPGLKVLADPHLSVVAFTSDEVDLFRVAELMSRNGWLPGLLKEPKAIHRLMSLVHHPVLDEYLSDLRDAVETVRATGAKAEGIEAIY
ncbi:aspartate aminotransferase family protein [Aquicoccus porphyridii]|uniref:Aspartate aminotransferase family protein n=1 Tax=Aquicoccus porphyridii TaxID=1852029 RepID=A0A5A9YYD3_9RHOB|nr:aspartate aminotransferase family protein [Aquicoccus porphyridii]KAA0910013.1 aspartate aminotransferase family protein [Aquicoccus porphyridii]RAI52119.1 aspartate aminotransferase family protein [Rhodobacteraceae bacterium AsT-22]